MKETVVKMEEFDGWVATGKAAEGAYHQRLEGVKSEEVEGGRAALDILPEKVRSLNF